VPASPTSCPPSHVRFKRRKWGRVTDHGISDGFLAHFHEQGVAADASLQICVSGNRIWWLWSGIS
jgi:hypothetical protein